MRPTRREAKSLAVARELLAIDNIASQLSYCQEPQDYITDRDLYKATDRVVSRFMFLKDTSTAIDNILPRYLPNSPFDPFAAALSDMITY